MAFDIDRAADSCKKVITGLACDYAEVRFSSGAGTTITLSDQETDSFSSGEIIAGSVRVLKDGAWSFISFNDPGYLESALKRGLEIASSMSVKERSSVKGAPVWSSFFSTSMEIDFNKITADEKFELIKKYNDILRSSSMVQTTRATYRDSGVRYIFLNSEGSDLRYDRSYCGIALSSVARDGAVIQPFHKSVSGYGGYELALGKEDLAESVVKTAVDLLKAESVPGGIYPVIVDPRLSGVFIHEAFGHLSEADFVYENEQMKKIMVLGREFGPEDLNVYDDGSLTGVAGHVPFDDEGVAPEKTALISKGRLSGRLHSRETAQKMDEQLTGNGRAISVMKQPIVRMTNTYIEDGPYNPDELFRSMEDGIYACEVIGGQTNLEMFTFTSGYGYEIKKGKPGKMFKDIVLSGNVFKTLKSISMIANDRKMFGGLGGCGKGGQSPLPVSYGGPHMLINNVLIGGKQ